MDGRRGLVQVSRLLAGKALYVPPSIDFVPLIYPPLFFYASALIAKIIGLGFGALRLRFISYPQPLCDNYLSGS